MLAEEVAKAAVISGEKTRAVADIEKSERRIQALDHSILAQESEVSSRMARLARELQ